MRDTRDKRDTQDTRYTRAVGRRNCEHLSLVVEFLWSPQHVDSPVEDVEDNEDHGEHDS